MILPSLDKAFGWRRTPFGPALVCEALEPFARHFFTTRAWTLGAADGDAMRTGWDDVARAAEAPPERLIRAHQVHGADVVVHRADAPDQDHPLCDADIIVSSHPSDPAAIQTADCVPLLIVDRRTGAVAAAHAGWRGLAAGVPGVTIAALAREFGARPDDLLAVAGPSIGACCYEVGRDVRDRFAAEFSSNRTARWFQRQPQPTAANPSMASVPSQPRDDHWYFDGWSATRDQLEAAGIPAAQIFVSELCTASHPSALCSYRRDGGGAGRMAGLVRPRVSGGALEFHPGDC